MASKLTQIIDPVKHFLMESATDPVVYMQAITVVAALFLAKLGSFATKKYVNSIHKESKLQQSVSARLLKLITPVYTVILLVIADAFFSEVVKSSQVTTALLKLSVVWVILRGISIFSHSETFTRIAGIIILPIAVLSVTNLLTPTIKYLDSFSFGAGNFKTSLYIIIKAIIALIFMVWVAKVILREGRKDIRKMTNLEYNIRELMVKIFEVAVYGVAFFIMLNIIGLDVTTLAVFGGALGVGIGLGLQKIASNFMSGIILLMGKSVRVGDVIEIEGTSASGVVRDMGARNLLLERFDGKEILIPNEDLITSRVTNWTYSHTRLRVDIMIGVSYDSDVEKAMQVMIDIASAHPEVIKEPEPPNCQIEQFADSAITLQLFFWIGDLTVGRSRVRSDVMLAILKEFRDSGIEIPYPQREVYINNKAS